MLTPCCPLPNCYKLIVQSRIASLSLHLSENHFVYCRLHSYWTKPRHLLAMDKKCQLRVFERGTCGVTSGVNDVVHSCTPLLYVWCCIITFTIQAHVGDAFVGLLCMYINEHFQPKLRQVVHKKGAFQIPVQNALLIIQHNWGGIEQHMNHTSGS